ncbi:MAG TPA: carboxypeptidase regulatory-like domain-containing protein [Vicinamibacterales bacterium]
MQPLLRAACAAASLVTLTTLAAAAPAPPAGALRGRVDVLHPLKVSHTVQGRSDERAVTETRRQSVVYFDDVPADPNPPSPMRSRMHQTNETFVPHMLAVTAGSTVDFPNDDRTYHNVFSLSKTKQFDLGRYAAGRSKSVTFDRPGIVRVFCDIHSHMNAFILVFDHRFFALTDQEGRYRIDQIPPGTYQVTAWYEGIALQSQRVTIPAGGTADLDFRLRQ